jgi:glycogen(starch) synthase
MERRKGTSDLLRAMPEIVKQVPEVHFTLIGVDRRHCPGGRTHAEFAADELPRDVQDRISFLGELPTPEVDRWLQSADLFVAPSLYESFGLIFLEAMRWQTPVIGTRTGGIPEIIQDGVTGALVAPGSPRELAAKMVELLNDDAQRARLGLAGRRRVEEHFSVERMAQRVSRFYADTLNARRRR